MLESVKIKTDNKNIRPLELEPYIKQKPNFKTFEVFKLPLFIYNLSGQDTTKWINRTLRKGGEPPVIYDSTAVDQTIVDLKRILWNKGYVHAQINPQIEKRKKKVRVKYNIACGDPYIIDEYKIEVPDSVFAGDIYSNPGFVTFDKKEEKRIANTNINSLLKQRSLVNKNQIFDLDMLDEERTRISSVFRNSGYFHFNKEYVGFVADTTAGGNRIDLELAIYPFTEKKDGQAPIEKPHKQYKIREVEFYVDYSPLSDGHIDNYQASAVERIGGDYTIHYGRRGRYIRPSVIFSNCFILAGAFYSERMTNLTYSSFAQLKILKNVNITYYPCPDNPNELSCVITCVPDKKQGFSAEIEGTNSDWMFGIGAGIGYLHRNIFRGSEFFNIKLHGAYEAITPDFSKFDDNYFEVGGEMSLTLPRFVNPFLSRDLKRRMHSSTQLFTDYSYQRRPNYFIRTILSGGIKYIWNSKNNTSIKHAVDLLNVSYVHLPSVEDSFLEGLPDEAKYYSFKDQFILGTGYTYYNSNFIPGNKRLPVIKTFRASIETAGNLLSLIANVSKQKENEEGSKEVFNTAFSQYVRGTADYSHTIKIDEKNSLAWRIGGGLAYPYGNNKLIPIQKRFFSGGANSVRGWAIRELGPGAYYSPDANFYFQSGDIRFDAGIEYRSKVFWIIELAAFLDAGNIWTIKEYEKQERGAFKFDTFYKQIAGAWGLGIRFDFDFVLIRLDCGWKLYDPAKVPKYRIDELGNQIFDGYKSQWPVTKPFRISKNTAWHIAVGYPF
ncbi:hypothetical protein M2132_000956 [Dysgonomonas sp. PH5-45]|uniref:translocation and assembly module lipoprotein TamL n=1 Tax=unclassified Dysgonomonas TaxID=2630389 RepID=UPI00247541F2|nr:MULTISPECIES: BamA/TamA family outer membrane protein [unclassified Dysgonomonas]MDH6354628.1 hypothetical protein [Dysgonomonas sp. PH5-45]MDH6387526.1 hypothetical protein [Dysgonomonas sp. PH5-37]